MPYFGIEGIITVLGIPFEYFPLQNFTLQKFYRNRTSLKFTSEANQMMKGAEENYHGTAK
jgi:hypothetical protein